MTTKEIISEWLSSKENRDRLPIIKDSAIVWDIYRSVSDIYTFAENEELVNVFSLNGNYFKFILDEEAHS